LIIRQMIKEKTDQSDLLYINNSLIV
jgi:hypothetical protein